LAAFAYLLPPLTGLIAYLFGSSVRARRHGLQSIAFGLVWPVGLLVAAALSDTAAQAVFGVGGVLWLTLLGLAAAGRDPHLPGTRAWLQQAAESAPREPPAGVG
jgi:hypothetical protein